MKESDVDKWIQIAVQRERQRIVTLIRQTYADLENEETGSLVWTEDIVELIESPK